MGVSSGNVSDYKKECLKPSSYAIINISNFFNVSAGFLFLTAFSSALITSSWVIILSIAHPMIFLSYRSNLYPQ